MGIRTHTANIRNVTARIDQVEDDAGETVRVLMLEDLGNCEAWEIHGLELDDIRAMVSLVRCLSELAVLRQ